jgi:hypothetical protein
VATIGEFLSEFNCPDASVDKKAKQHILIIDFIDRMIAEVMKEKGNLTIWEFGNLRMMERYQNWHEPDV